MVAPFASLHSIDRRSSVTGFAADGMLPAVIEAMLSAIGPKGEKSK